MLHLHFIALCVYLIFEVFIQSYRFINLGNLFPLSRSFLLMFIFKYLSDYNMKRATFSKIEYFEIVFLVLCLIEDFA
jgi:preprotein translocase subunit SecG